MKKIIYLALVALTLTSCKTYTAEYYSVYHEIIGKEAANEFSKNPPSYHNEVVNNVTVRTPNIKVIGTVAMPDGQVKYIFEERLYNTKENAKSSDNPNSSTGACGVYTDNGAFCQEAKMPGKKYCAKHYDTYLERCNYKDANGKRCKNKRHYDEEFCKEHSK